MIILCSFDVCSIDLVHITLNFCTSTGHGYFSIVVTLNSGHGNMLDTLKASPEIASASETDV